MAPARPSRRRAWPARVRSLAAAAALVIPLLAGCNALVAQNPRSPLQPVNAVRWADEPRLMLGGRDLVAYFADRRSVQGSPAFRAEYELVGFHFANAEHQALFQANPRAYLPAYHGFCAAGMLAGVPRGGAQAAFALIDGRLFLFADEAAKEAFLRDPAANVARADQVWRGQVEGRNSDWLRLKRWADPLPPAGG